MATRVPFEQADAVADATLITPDAHRLGLAAGQKNTPEPGRRISRSMIGFDFAVAEQCGRDRERSRDTSVFGGRRFDVEYDNPSVRRACASVGTRISVIRRDLNATPTRGHRHIATRPAEPA